MEQTIIVKYFSLHCCHNGEKMQVHTPIPPNDHENKTNITESLSIHVIVPGYHIQRHEKIADILKGGKKPSL